MIAIIGGPGEKKDEKKPSGFGVSFKLKPKKIGGIGGGYGSKDEEEESEGEGLGEDGKKLEAAREVIAAVEKKSPERLVSAFEALFNCFESEPHEENTEGKEPEGEEGE